LIDVETVLITESTNHIPTDKPDSLDAVIDMAGDGVFTGLTIAF